MIRVTVAEEVFDPGAEIAAIARHGVGAVASFVGFVRGSDGLVALTLEHYPAMTQAALNRLAECAMSRWQLHAVTLHHRTGRLAVGDEIVFVGTGAAHRGAALESCAFLIDRLKTDAPFWKRESFADGREVWVEARDGDLQVASRWG